MIHRGRHARFKGFVTPVRALIGGFFAAGMVGVVWANCVAPDDLDPDSLIRISEGIAVDMMTDGVRTYRIIAEQGLMEEQSRIVWMESPHVTIFGEAGTESQRVSGDLGRLWPVEVVTTNKDGTIDKVQKFNWALCGDVLFNSADGYRIETPELEFDSSRRLISGDQGVSYRLPTGKDDGSFIYGEAAGFETAVGSESPGMGAWTLLGPGQLRFNDGKVAP